LDKRVRSDHPLRRINETLELDFVRREVAQFYGTKGNVSEDPVVIMKMMLLLFLDNVRSERELMRIIPERLDYMYLLVPGWPSDEAKAAALGAPQLGIRHQARGVFELPVARVLHPFQNRPQH